LDLLVYHVRPATAREAVKPAALMPSLRAYLSRAMVLNKRHEQGQLIRLSWKNMETVQ
jgi:hypothetical protein